MALKGTRLPLRARSCTTSCQVIKPMIGVFGIDRTSLSAIIVALEANIIGVGNEFWLGGCLGTVRDSIGVLF